MRVVLCTAPADHAERIATGLVSGHLAACVNVIPGVVSIYRWNGEVHRDQESLLVIKTRDELLPALREAIERSHPYEVPEIVALTVPDEDVNEAYVRWVREVTSIERSTRSPT